MHTINTMQSTRRTLQNGLIDQSPILWKHMPSYDFYNNDTGEVEEHFMSYTKLDEFKENNPHLKQQVTAPQIVGGTGDRVKTDAGFKEVLSKVGDAYPGSTVDRRYNGVNIKDQKTRDVVKKHMDIQSKGKK